MILQQRWESQIFELNYSSCDQYMMQHPRIFCTPRRYCVLLFLQSCLSFIIGNIGFITSARFLGLMKYLVLNIVGLAQIFQLKSTLKSELLTHLRCDQGNLSCCYVQNDDLFIYIFHVSMLCNSNYYYCGLCTYTWFRVNPCAF